MQRALTPVPVGAARQTTLVAGIDSHKHVAGTMILARVDGTRHAVEILTVPSTVSVSSSQRLHDVLRFDGVSRAIRLLERDLHVPVNHVLLIQLAQVGSIVRSLGGITISNPRPVPYNVTGGHGVFPVGRVALTGRTVQWYLDPTEHALTAGIVRRRRLPPGDRRARRHRQAGAPDDALGDHGRGQHHLAQLQHRPLARPGARDRRGAAACATPWSTAAWAPAPTSAGRGAIPTVAGFQTAARLGACTTRPLKTKLPAAAVAATIIATIVTHGGSQALYWLVVATIAIWGIGACAWILMLPAVRGVHRRSRAGALPPPIRRPARARAPRPRLPRLSRPGLPRMPHVTLPSPGPVRLPHIGRPGRAHTRYGRVYRRRRIGSYLFVRIISVPVSILVGMLIAHVLY